jgi:hypothetical protein
MGTTTVATVEPAPTQEQPKVKKPRRTVSVGFSGPEGASLRISLRISKDGKSATTWVSHKASKGAKSTRGATQTHASLAEAEKAVGALAAKALAKGWEKKVRVGFVRAPDAFDVASLPAPVKAKGKK